MTASPAARPLPTGRLGRLAGMARAGLGLARGALRDDPTGPVADAVEALAELRGLATKAGQMAGVWSAALPEAERRRVEPLLARLRASTASSDPAAVRALVEAELGAPLGALFAEFDEAPFASASLGQVHRARLPAAESGLEVAVKVQHPGIDVALRADLDHAARFGGVAALFAVPGAGAMVDEFRARIAEELDYEAEGRWLTRFAALLAGDPVLATPQLVASRSSRRVLTTTFARGHTVAEARRGPHAAAQARAIRGFLRGAWVDRGLLFADPHPGNWVFHDDGRVTVLDFGSVLAFDAVTCARLGEALRALDAGDGAGARRAVRDLLGVGDAEAAAPTVDMFTLALGALGGAWPGRETLAALGEAGAVAKRRMLGSRLALPAWFPMVLRALLGATALFVELTG